MAARAPTARASFGLKAATVAVLLFLHLPLTVIILFAFTTEDAAFRFPPPGLTVNWFGVAWQRADIWDAPSVSVRVGGLATPVAPGPGAAGGRPAGSRRTAYSQVEPSVDLGAPPFQAFRYIVLPSIATALPAGGILAFALSF